MAEKSNLITIGDEKKAFIAKYTVSDKQKTAWNKVVDDAVANGLKGLDGQKSLLKTVQGNN
jgi:hypothetical protein